MKERAVAVEKWNIDKAHSSVGFSVRHMVISRVKGTFTDWSAELDLDPDDLSASHVEVSVNTASVDTHESARDEHLRSADFFDSVNHPQMLFRSTRMDAQGAPRLTIYGELTIRGITKEVALDAEYGGRLTDPWGNDRVGFEAKATLDRRDFGLTWNAALETGGLLVSDSVGLAIELEATRARSAEPTA
jgi:polyisoprenoid-binding protein YceI